MLILKTFSVAQDEKRYFGWGWGFYLGTFKLLFSIST